jgi:hypothetical protein
MLHILCIRIHELPRLYYFNSTDQIFFLKANSRSDGQDIPFLFRLAKFIKDEAYQFYIKTQYVPRCKHSPLLL